MEAMAHLQRIFLEDLRIYLVKLVILRSKLLQSVKILLNDTFYVETPYLGWSKI